MVVSCRHMDFGFPTTQQNLALRFFQSIPRLLCKYNAHQGRYNRPIEQLGGRRKVERDVYSIQLWGVFYVFTRPKVKRKG